jgi:ribonuclease III
MRADPVNLEASICYRFTDSGLLLRALTHTSSAQENNSGTPHNEQLEFLGDSVLGLVIAEHVYRVYPSYREGRLSKLKAHLAGATHLEGVARTLDLGAYLDLGKGEEMTGGRAKRALLVDSLEAVIAAIYLDGGYAAAADFVARFILPGLEELPEHLDYKGELQEYAQARHLPQPRYSPLEERGPEHAKTFLVEVKLGRNWTARGEGRTKKAASQEAARILLGRLPATTDPYGSGDGI